MAAADQATRYRQRSVHTKGAIATARTSDAVNPERASSGSQFYIALEALPQLDGAYTVFGQVVEGMDVVESIAIGDIMESITITEE
jgi:cyclophilin family peptidyl-prolyl cis-trans isomerase